MTRAILLVTFGGILSVATVISSIIPVLLGGGGDGAVPTMGNLVTQIAGGLGLLMVVFGIFQMYVISNDPSHEHNNPVPPKKELTFSEKLAVSAGTITRYLDRPGIAADHPLTDLPPLLKELSNMEDGIPRNKRSLVVVAATQIADIVAEDTSFKTSGPNPQLADEIVSKLGALRDELAREDTEQIDLTLSVLSRQLNRL